MHCARCWHGDVLMLTAKARVGKNVRVWQILDNRRQVVSMAVGTLWETVSVPWCAAMASHGANGTGTVPPVSSTSKSDFLVNGKYRLVRKIGSGSFGEIYLGINVSSGEVQFQLHFRVQFGAATGKMRMCGCVDVRIFEVVKCGCWCGKYLWKSSESVQCAISGRCLRHR